MRTKLIILTMALCAFFVAVSCDSSDKDDVEVNGTEEPKDEPVIDEDETGKTDENTSDEEVTIPEDDEDEDEDDGIRKVAIACHRGYWNSNIARGAQNSLASLYASQYYGFWGSEFDIHLCTDGVILIYHDQSINGKRFDAYPSTTFADVTLDNGESIPTFDEYLALGAEDPNCMLVCEIKTHSTTALEDSVVEVMVEKIKEADLYDPNRIMFISFSQHICETIAKDMPEFTNQYLNGDLTPTQLSKLGINGLDYDYSILKANPDWIEEAHELGMSVNTYTVNSRSDIETMLDLGVDCITTNDPVLVRTILGEKGLKEL